MKQSFQRWSGTILAGVAAFVLAVPSARAATTETWNGSADLTWGNASNWTGGIPTGTSSTDTALFNTSTGGTIALGASYSVGSITFDTSVGSYTIGAVGGTNGLTLASGGTIEIGTSATSVTGTNLTETFNAPLVLAGTTYTFKDFSTTPSNALVFAGPISGTSGATTLTLTGTTSPTTATSGVNVISGVISNGGASSLALSISGGIWTLSGANTMTGGVTINRGILNINNANALGTGGFTLGANSSTLDNTSGAAVTLAGSGSVTDNGTFTFTGTNDLSMGSWSFLLNGNGSQNWVISGSHTFTVNGTLSAAGTVTAALTKTGTGTLALGGSNGAFTNGVNLSAGGLDVNSATALGTGTFTIGSGTTLDNTSGSAISLTTGNAQTWNSFTFAGSNDLNLGSGAVTIATASAVTVTVAAKTLTASGTITNGNSLTKAGAGTLSLGVLSGTGGVSVTGGTLILTGASTYSGATSVSAGAALRAGGSSVLSSSSNITLAGGTIGFVSGGDYSEGSSTAIGLGVLTLTANSFLDFGGGNDLLHFNASSAKWSTYTLSIYNWDASNDSLYFGTAATALNTTQLADMLFYSDSGSTLIGSGATISSIGQITMIAAPEPSTWALIGFGVFGLVAVVRRRHAAA